MSRKQILFLAALSALLIVTFLLKGVDSSEKWIGSSIAYGLGVYWAHSFVFNKNMHLLTMSTPLSYENDDHKPFRFAVFCAACFLMLSILAGVN